MKSATTFDLNTYYSSEEKASPKPYKEHFLTVDPQPTQHTLYVAEYGNPEGIPVVLFHGGPGGGSSPKYARLIDPAKYRLIMFDQRGCGQSTPFGVLENNTTQLILEDIEKIRHYFKIDKWIVFGGSWGSTLALLYSQKHPEHVMAMVLRGIFLARPDDRYEYFTNYSMAARTYPNEWQAFIKKTAGFAAKTGIEIKRIANGEPDYIDFYYQLLNFQEEEKELEKTIAYQAAIEVSRWEKQISTLNPPSQESLDEALAANGLSMGRIEIYFSQHKFFLSDAELILNQDNLAKIRTIPTTMVQGIYDQVCPANQAATLAAELQNVTLHRVIAGHSMFDPAIVHMLIQTFQSLPCRLGLEMRADDISVSANALKTTGFMMKNQKNYPQEQENHDCNCVEFTK